MLLAAMLAMVLVAAAPAMAQDAVAGDVDNSVSVQYADCDTIQAAAAEQYGGDAVALGDAAAASVANELGVSQESVTACLGSTAAGGDIVANGVDDDGDGAVDEADEAAAAEGAAAAGTTVLPDTGGASLFTLGAGALLVGGGLLARRIFR